MTLAELIEFRDYLRDSPDYINLDDYPEGSMLVLENGHWRVELVE